MSDKINTRDHNIDILHGLGFNKVRNTTVFQNGEKFILSPAVAENTNGKYWFDVRQVNLNRINESSLLLVRIVLDLFILESLPDLSSLFSMQVMDNRPNSGNVWGIHIDMDIAANTALLFNIKNPGNRIAAKLLNKKEVSYSVEEIFKQSI